VRGAGIGGGQCWCIDGGGGGGDGREKSIDAVVVVG